MTNTPIQALLPAGLRDVLFPDAGHEADAVTKVMGYFGLHGYDRVKPPLIEFEDSLLDGAGAATASQSFRVMDPMSQKMMGVRADITPQVARIAAARLASAPRPLRLAYAGEVLRVKGNQLNPERQYCQVGLELIGPSVVAADAEVLTLAAGALELLGVPGISVDLTLPTLVPAVLASADLPRDSLVHLREALNHKDAAGVKEWGGSVADILLALLEAAGPLDRGLARLNALTLPPEAAALREQLMQVVAQVRILAPHLTLTVDPVENLGFEYHKGVSFTLFSRLGGGELGRGGRYVSGGGEAATGASLFMDAVLAVADKPVSVRRVYVPLGGDPAKAAALRSQGWVTVSGLEPLADSVSEARRLGCSHVLRPDGDGSPSAV